MNRPLSETHPTLFKVIQYKAGYANIEEQDVVQYIQSCTVDVGFHNKEVLELEIMLAGCIDGAALLRAEVERLKKELDKLKYDSSRMICEAAEKSFVQGEHRQKEKTREAIERVYNRTYLCGDKTFRIMLEKELGLSEEEKK